MSVNRGGRLDPSADVRNATIFSISFAAWKQFRELLQKTEQFDADPEVRKFAADALISLEKYNWEARS